MTNAEKTILKQEAKKGLKENNIKVFQKDMVLLECSYHYENFWDCKIMIVDYVMIEDRKSHKQYQIRYGKHYNSELETLYSVEEYTNAFCYE